MGMNLCRRRIELCSDPTALNRRDDLLLALAPTVHITAGGGRRAAALSSHPRGRRFGHANVPGYNTGARPRTTMQLGTEVHTPHPNISLTRSQVGAQPMRDGVGCSSHGPHGYYVNCNARYDTKSN